jgi:hypothetical protein
VSSETVTISDNSEVIVIATLPFTTYGTLELLTYAALELLAYGGIEGILS